MTAKKPASVGSVSVRLVRADKTVDTAMRSENKFHEVPSETGRLFVGQSPSNPPAWASFVREAAGTTADVELQNKSCGAVLFLSAGRAGKPDRIFAFTFGTGHLALDPDAIERGFGLKVTLNKVERSKLRTLDVASLDATVIQRRTQASRDIDIDEFGLNKHQDLLRLAAGTPDDTGLARTLSGRDSLTLNRRYSTAELKALCSRLLALHEGKEYQKHYKFIDNVRPVQDRLLLSDLDGLAFAEIKALVSGQMSDLHLSLPEILDPSRSLEVSYLGATLKPGRKSVYPDIEIADYVQELRLGKFADLTLDAWRTTHEIRFSEAGETDREKHHRIHNCIVWEAIHNGIIYVAFGGEWFAIDKLFYKEIEEDFRRLVSATPVVASTAARNEQELLVELDARPDLLLMDKTKTNPVGAPRANIEFCDFLGSDRKLIHLKDGHASTSISHLWSQGVVGSESFLRDEGFRRHLLKHVRARQKDTSKSGFDGLLPRPAKRPTTRDFTVAYGIMRTPLKRSGKLDIPFFSKVSLRAAAQRLQDLGFNVEVQLIEMT
jgi:uncharacterized protein (TIGR04141 family)